MYLHARRIPTHRVNAKAQYAVTVSLTRSLNLSGQHVESLTTWAYDPCHAIERALILMHGEGPRDVTYVDLGGDEAELTITR